MRIVSAARSRTMPSVASTAATISSGSAKRPAPTMPHARYPLPGSTMRTPRLRRTLRFSCVAGCFSISTFIVGAMITGADVAR